MRIFFFIFLVVSFYGCIRDNKIPEEIIPQNEMRKLIWDLMRADAYVSDFIMKDSSCNRKDESLNLYEQVFSLHATTKEAFKNSLAFYESRPDLLKTITDSLRRDEKKVMEYENYKKPQSDTTFRKMKLNKKLSEKEK